MAYKRIATIHYTDGSHDVYQYDTFDFSDEVFVSINIDDLPKSMVMISKSFIRKARFDVVKVDDE